MSTASRQWFAAYDFDGVWAYGHTPEDARENARRWFEKNFKDDDEIRPLMRRLRVTLATDALQKTPAWYGYCDCRASRQDPVVLHVPDVECPLFGRGEIF